MSSNNQSKSTERVAIFSAALFLFGLAALITMGWVWPGILLLIFMLAVPIAIAEEGWLMGLWITGQTAVWLFGMAFLLRYNMIWPGVLVLAGLSAMIVAIAPPDKVEAISKRPKTRDKAKRDFEKAKRGLPLPEDLARLEADEQDDVRELMGEARNGKQQTRR